MHRASWFMHANAIYCMLHVATASKRHRHAVDARWWFWRSEQPTVQTNNEVSTVKQLSVEQELQQAILASTCAVIKTPSSRPSTSQELMKVIRQEMTLFENGGNRGRYLQLVYDYLLSIPPTSVEAERAFSASGLICSRLRTRLGDETLDALCFLRSYSISSSWMTPECLFESETVLVKTV